MKDSPVRIGIDFGSTKTELVALYDFVPKVWGKYIFSDFVHTQLKLPVHGDSSGVRGAAWLWPKILISN